MCGRYTLIPNVDALVEFFQLSPEVFALLEPRYNIAPSQSILVIRDKDKSRQAEQMAWGLIPAWSQDGKSNANLINARGETLTQNSLGGRGKSPIAVRAGKCRSHPFPVRFSGLEKF